MSLRSEIAEQPKVVARLLEVGWPEARTLARPVAAAEHLTIAARGSSDNAATYGKYLFESLAGIVTALAAPSLVTRYRTPPSFARGAVIGISQSGAAPDVAAVLAEARAVRAPTVAITNKAGSLLARTAAETFLLRCGPERSVAATKTYTGQLLHFYMLAEALSEGARLGYEAIPDFAARALEVRPVVEQFVERYVFMENCVVVGRGLVYANAFEMALKLMETCYVVAERFSSADFLHGPLAVVERHFPIFAFAPPGVTLAGVRELLARLRELRADTLVFTADAEAASLATRAVLLPAEIEETLAVIPYIIPAQLFAALLADAKGLDTDAPRSLAKVTRTL